MEKNTFLLIASLTGCLAINTLQAQTPTPSTDKKSEQIIITTNGDSNKKMTVQVAGDSVTVNGKPLTEYHDGDVKVIRRDFRNRSSDNFLFAPDNQEMNLELLQNDDVKAAPHAFLGVLSEKSGDGVKINEVVKGSAAEKAGLLKDDIITKIDEKTIASPQDLSEAVRSHKAGDAIKIYALRDNSKKDFNVKLGESKAEKRMVIVKKMRPDMEGDQFQMPPMPNMNNNFFSWKSNSERPKLGMKITDSEDNAGVKVMSVEEGSPADKAGLKSGDIITSLNGEKITTVDDIMDQLNDAEQKDTLDIQAARNHQEMKFSLKVPRMQKSADL